MKKLGVLCLLLCMVLLLQLSVVPVLATDTTEDTTAPVDTVPPQSGPAIAPQGQSVTVMDSDASITHGCNTIDAQVPLGGSQAMLKTARSAILYELNSGTMLYSFNPDARMEPAGLVKIMTVLLALENGNLEEMVTATEDVLSTVPKTSTNIKIAVGETLSVKDLIYGSMVGSGNDACAVLAVAISGSQEAFAALMNQRAKEMGCTDTNFTNAHGLSDVNQYSTARDMGRILEVALQNEQFREIFGTTSYWVDENEHSDARYLMTSNYFMSKESQIVKFFDPRVTGGRSGSVSNDDRSMSCTAKSGDLNLMSIVMGCQAELEADGYSLHYMGNMEETADLLEWGFKFFSVNQILNSGKSAAQFPVVNGSNHVVLRPAESKESAVPYGTTGDYLNYEYLLDNGGLSAPVQENMNAGIVQVWYGSICLAQTDLVTMNASAVDNKPVHSGLDIQDEQAQTSGLGLFLQGLGIAFAAVVVIIILFIVLRLIRGAVIRSRRRRRRMSRRRSR